MSWFVKWANRESKYTVNEVEARDEDEAVTFAKNAMQLGAVDIEISQAARTIDGTLPYVDIAEALNERNVIPFLGAGVPLSDPNRRSPGWIPGSAFLPNATELARHFARMSGMPVHYLRDSANLARVASYFGATNKYEFLTKALRIIFSAGTPTPIHKLIAKEIRRPKVIVTTNYDLLMERALDEAGRKYDRVLHCTTTDEEACVLVWLHEKKDEKPKFYRPDELDDILDPEKRTILYKMHGSIDTPPPEFDPKTQVRDQDNRFVITEEHYVDFLSRINVEPPIVPKYFNSYFRENSFLFLGYSLDDWNLRVILHSLGHVLPSQSSQKKAAAGKDNIVKKSAFGVSQPSRSHWSIQLNPTAYDEKIWDTRNVKIGNQELTEFANSLRWQLLPPDDLRPDI